jgi:hypothetical protein
MFGGCPCNEDSPLLESCYGLARLTVRMSARSAMYTFANNIEVATDIAPGGNS